MATRRDFLKASGLTIAGFLASNDTFTAIANTSKKVEEKFSSASPLDFTSMRPIPSQRLFTSDAVEKAIKNTTKKIQDKKIAWLFNNCFPNTLDTTCNYQLKNGKPDTFVITGDIHAMWLRDSSAQVFPYIPFANQDKKLKLMLQGVIFRQTACILIDPYANAFNEGPTGSEWEKDHTTMKKELHERKWEIDSLCSPIRFAYQYWKETGDTTPFDDDWERAIELIHKTFVQQQRKENLGPYRFTRVTDRQGDTMLNDGWGSPVKPVGLIFSAFRPSDDATLFGFLIPSNFFAVTSLRQAAEMIRAIRNNETLASRCESLANEVEAAIKEYGIIEHPKYGKVYAFEVDGYRNYVLMDDANVPSLLALPYLKCVSIDDPIYQNTRRMILSEDNPYFFKGSAGEGIGGPHIGFGYIWPMSLIMRANTTVDEDEILKFVHMLRDTDGNTGFMHESFQVNDPNKFTRKWFAWANTLFGEMIYRLVQENKIQL